MVNKDTQCEKCGGTILYEETDNTLGSVFKCVNCGKRYFECDITKPDQQGKKESFDFIQIRKSGYFKAPVATIWKSGRICINGVALRMFNPKNFLYANLFYDKQKNALGIKFVENGSNCFTLIKHLQNGGERRIIDTRSVLKCLKIKIEKPIKIPIIYDKDSEFLILKIGQFRCEEKQK